jgi:hypothetical protein
MAPVSLPLLYEPPFGPARTLRHLGWVSACAHPVVLLNRSSLLTYLGRHRLTVHPKPCSNRRGFFIYPISMRNASFLCDLHFACCIILCVVHNTPHQPTQIASGPKTRKAGADSNVYQWPKAAEGWLCSLQGGENPPASTHQTPQRR